MTAIGELAEDVVDLGAGADIDAARRVVEDEDRGVGDEPPATCTFCWFPPLSGDGQQSPIGRGRSAARSGAAIPS